jgi:hypothetical protein
VPVPDLFGARADLPAALDDVDEGEEEPADLEPQLTLRHSRPPRPLDIGHQTPDIRISIHTSRSVIASRKDATDLSASV